MKSVYQTTTIMGSVSGQYNEIHNFNELSKPYNKLSVFWLSVDSAQTITVNTLRNDLQNVMT